MRGIELFNRTSHFLQSEKDYYLYYLGYSANFELDLIETPWNVYKYNGDIIDSVIISPSNFEKIRYLIKQLVYRRFYDNSTNLLCEIYEGFYNIRGRPRIIIHNNCKDDEIFYITIREDRTFKCSLMIKLKS